MQFVLAGFTHDMGFRVFAFERIADDRTRTGFTVRTDLALIQKYAIRLQELPLMCRGILEQQSEDDEKRALILTEAEISGYAKTCQAAKDAAALKRKPPRRPPTENLGAAWRGPQA